MVKGLTFVIAVWAVLFISYTLMDAVMSRPQSRQAFFDLLKRTIKSATAVTLITALVVYAIVILF